MEQGLMRAYFVEFGWHVQDRSEIRAETDISKRTVSLFHKFPTSQVANNKGIEIYFPVYYLMLMSESIKKFIFRIDVQNS